MKEVVWDILDNSLLLTAADAGCAGFLQGDLLARRLGVNRESAKKRIKMPGVFKQLHNHYVNHTYTDIGNNLLNTYERYFWAYERAHPEDVSDARCVTCEQDRVEKPGQMLLGATGAGIGHPRRVRRARPDGLGRRPRRRGDCHVVRVRAVPRFRREVPEGVIAFESERVTRTELETGMKRRAEAELRQAPRHAAAAGAGGTIRVSVRPTRDPDAACLDDDDDS